MNNCDYNRNENSIITYINQNITIMDGGMGTQLQSCGLSCNEKTESWNISHPDEVQNVHLSYLKAGANIIATNTFGANPLKYSDDELENIITSAVNIANCAKNEYIKTTPHTQEVFIVLDIGPLGKLLKPLGDLEFEDAVNAFAKIIKIGSKLNIDALFFETFTDNYETKAAIIAAKENSDLPIFVSNAYDENGKLLSGTSPREAVTILEGLGADALGMNCSLGPKELIPIAKKYLSYSSTPVILKPNAGLPVVVDGNTVFNTTDDEFAEIVAKLVKDGIRMCGGCCGTTPEYIRKLNSKIENIQPVPIDKKNITSVASSAKTCIFDNKCILIGERINPTGKKKLKQALIENDDAYILNEALIQVEKGADILDVNVGIPDIDESEKLPNLITKIQSVTSLPLQIDTSDFKAMEKSMRIYNGKPLVNSVSGKQSSMDKVFPLLKKYGGVLIALTLDENGIPETAEERVEIAKKIIKEAAKYDISPADIIFDPLALTISADANSGKTTLKAVKMLNNMGLKTSLGVSNISFGLPNRPEINRTFFTLCLNNGLSAAIINVNSEEMMNAFLSYNALNGLDENFEEYINKNISTSQKTQAVTTENTLKNAVFKGLCDESADLTKSLLKTCEPLDIINEHIIPALNLVGEEYDKQRIFLPGLLMSANAASAAFAEIKAFYPDRKPTKEKVALATVKGDIHDIGKNIVKLMFENYGYDVMDLGRDVSPETVLDCVKRNDIKLVGLSALMTTTVPAMAETIKLIKSNVPDCKIIVGGAVLTQEYADEIGADFYAKDALTGVRIAESLH